MIILLANFEIPLQLFLMNQRVQFCMLQMGIFLQMPVENFKRQFQSKIARTELERKWY